MTWRFDHYNLSDPKRVAEAKANNEAIKQLSGVSATAFRRRKERAMRIYDILSCIVKFFVSKKGEPPRDAS